MLAGFMAVRLSPPEQPAAEMIAPSPSELPVPVDLTATFEIFTNGTKRVFTQAMYHNQSPDAYIESPDPSVVHIKKANVTWDDFFRTLPFSLTKDCLVTGTRQTFCSNETKRLRFFLNGEETPNALELEIKANDALKVTYGE